jgi:hypothetical protein
MDEARSQVGELRDDALREVEREPVHDHDDDPRDSALRLLHS